MPNIDRNQIEQIRKLLQILPTTSVMEPSLKKSHSIHKGGYLNRAVDFIDSDHNYTELFKKCSISQTKYCTYFSETQYLP